LVGSLVVKIHAGQSCERKEIHYDAIIEMYVKDADGKYVGKSTSSILSDMNDETNTAHMQMSAKVYCGRANIDCKLA
jgi:hypothetical protein